MTEKLSDDDLALLREDISALATSYAHMLANGEKYDDGGLDVLDESIKYQQLASALDELAEYRQREAQGEAGRVVTISWEDGESASSYECGLEDCECPDHQDAAPTRGTYVTVRLDDENAKFHAILDGDNT